MLLNLSDLDNILSAAIDNLRHSSYSNSADLFQLLFDHGFRISETKLIHTWEIQSNDIVKCYTSKGSNPRFIPLNQFSTLIQHSIRTSTNYLVRKSMSAYEKNLRNHMLYSYFKIDNKYKNSHLFRHRYIKHLAASGLSIQQIKQDTGIISDQVVNNYINSKIYAFNFK